MNVRYRAMTCLFLLGIGGCAATSGSLAWLRNDHAEAIASDLAMAVSDRWSPTNDAVYVGDVAKLLNKLVSKLSSIVRSCL